MIVCSISGITFTSTTAIPNEFSHVASVLVFSSLVLPDKTSFPIIIIPAFIFSLLVIYKYK